MQYTERITRLESEGAFAVLAKAKEMEAEGHSVIHLQIGEPDFDTPANYLRCRDQGNPRRLHALRAVGRHPGGQGSDR